MVLENKLGITEPTELARQEEKISKKKALELFEKGFLNYLKQALTSDIDDREVYMRGIDVSYSYEGYFVYKTDEL